jgi:hypothetical protein
MDIGLIAAATVRNDRSDVYAGCQQRLFRLLWM